ncbi:MAG: hypothetical protein R6V85_08045 [Polyangia bacterium]
MASNLRLVPRIALFGGEDAAGNLSSELWLGSFFPRDESGFHRVEWERVPPGDISPPPRKNALLVYDHERSRLFMFGGEDHEGVRSNSLPSTLYLLLKSRRTCA